jgi:hypothetical protein
MPGKPGTGTRSAKARAGCGNPPRGRAGYETLPVW